MKRTHLLVLLSAISLFAALSAIYFFTAHRWPGSAYTEVRAFAWDPSTTRSEELIRADMSFADGVINKDGALLNTQQVQALLAAQAHRFKDRPVAGCYEPHNAFVFYNAQKKPVAFLEVCFDCLGARTYPLDKQCDPNFIALAKIFAELELPFGEYKTIEEFQEKMGWILNLQEQSPPKPK